MGEVGDFSTSCAGDFGGGRGRFSRFCGEVDVDKDTILSIAMESSSSFLCEFTS